MTLREGGGPITAQGEASGVALGRSTANADYLVSRAHLAKHRPRLFRANTRSVDAHGAIFMALLIKLGQSSLALLTLRESGGAVCQMHK